jgi:hypothetical protein
MARVLGPGGRVGISDIVVDDDLTAGQRAERGSPTGCIAGGLSMPDRADILRLTCCQPVQGAPEGFGEFRRVQNSGRARPDDP